MQNPQYDVTDREAGNNEGPGVLHAIGSSEFLNELWPGLGDEPTYDCQDCGEEVGEDDQYVIMLPNRFTPSEEILVCGDCLQDRQNGGYRNGASIRY